MAFAALNPMYEGLPDLTDRILRTSPVVALVGGYGPALIFGLPAFLYLRRVARPQLWICVLTGAAVAALPWAFMSLLPAAQEASTDGRATVIHGHLTLFGLQEAAKLVGEIGAFGALGGVTFWLIAAAGHRPAGTSG